MAKTYTQAFRDHLDQEVLTLATCWLLELKNGRKYGFTDLDRDLFFGGVNYLAKAAFSRTASRNTSDASTQNLDLTSILSDVAITPADLLAGDFDGASLRIFYVNYLSPPLDLLATPLDYHPLAIGSLGEFSSDGQAFTAQFRGLLDKFNQSSAWLTSQTCRYQLGDSNCGVGLPAFTTVATIADLVDQRTLFVSAPAPETADWFSQGVLTFTSGANAGSAYQIKTYTADRRLELFEPVRRAISLGDGVAIIAGCDKRSETCQNKFNNSINFGGEPHVPGWDATATGKGTPMPTTPPPALTPPPGEVSQPEPPLQYQPPPVFTMTADNAPAPFVASASSINGSATAWRAFNQSSVLPVWQSSAQPSTGTPQWLQIDLGGLFLASGARITPRDTIATDLPVDWQILVSADGVNFATALNVVGLTTGWAAQTARAFNFSSAVVVRYARFVCTATNAGPVSIAELEVI